MKKPSRRYICTVLILALIIAMFHIPAPVDGGKMKVIDYVVKEVIKKGNLVVGSLTGKFDQIHKSVDRAVNWIKDNKLATVQGLYVAYDASTHIMTFTDGEGRYSVDFVPDDENNQFNIYVNGESCTKLVYENLENCSEERISEKLAEAEKNAIAEYKSKHR